MSMLFILALCLLPALRANAQSGRNKPQKPATTTTTRPRSVNTAPAPREQTSPTPRPTATTPTSNERIPNNPAQLGEPPPFPTPAAKPTPARAEDEIDASDVVRINSNLVTVPASVLDASGKAVTNLKLEDFELRVDGQPRPISELGFADSPVRMAVLFDNSSSLIAAREFEKQAAIRFFRSVLRPVDQAMIYSVSTIPTLEHPLTSDVSALVRTIEHFPKPEGATALFDAIVQAANYLKPHQEGRRVIVIVSDGADTISDYDFETTLKRVQAADCQIYAVQTGQIENANLHDLAAERRLQEFTSQTGGAVYVPRGTSDLDNAFAQIAADLAQQYVLSYYPEDEQKDGRFRTINVRVTTRPGLRVRARKGYYATPGQRQAWLPNVTTTQVARNDAPLNLDQQSSVTIDNSGGGASNQAVSNQTANGAANNAARPVYLRTNNSSASIVRDRVGPRGPSDDLGGPSETKKSAEPEIIPNTAANASPPAASSSSTSSPPPGTAAPASSSSSSPPKKSDPPAESRPSSTPKPNEAKPSAESTSTESKAKKAESKSNTPSSTAQPTGPAPKVPVSGGVLNGKALSLPKPLYPLAAKNMGASGTVIVEVTVDETGKVISARAVSGHPLLQTACVNAARQAKFSPTILSGQAVQVLGTISYTFKPQ